MNAAIGRFIGLIIVTGFALAVVIMVTAGGRSRDAGKADDNPSEAPRTPVSVMQAELESIEITDSFSGMIEPMERFSLGFEIAGRVIEFGAAGNGAGKKKPLDEGDRVTAGQMLARLDDRALRSRLDEVRSGLDEAKARITDAKARLEQAQLNLNRARQLKRRGIGAITETEYQDYVTQLAVAGAQVDVCRAQAANAVARVQTAGENLKDATLASPVDGVISKRHVNVGESVNPQQAVMEIIQVDEVLLVVGVPEAYVGEIRPGQTVHVELLARDRFRKDRPKTDGRVRRVAEAADQTTGLFDVEVLLPNTKGKWRPGLIALAHIVLDRVRGFRIPLGCAVFRGGKTFLFAVDDRLRARRIELADWIEQDSDLVLLELPPQQRRVVTRGHHRLVDGREVRLVKLRQHKAGGTDTEPPLRSPAAVVRSKP